MSLVHILIKHYFPRNTRTSPENFLHRFTEFPQITVLDKCIPIISPSVLTAVDYKAPGPSTINLARKRVKQQKQQPASPTMPPLTNWSFINAFFPNLLSHSQPAEALLFFSASFRPVEKSDKGANPITAREVYVSRTYSPQWVMLS